MSYKALVEFFANIEDLPIPVKAVLNWIRDNTDHKDIRLYPVERHKQAFRGALRRIAIPRGNMYSADYEIVTQVLFAKNLPPDWKRLVIVKEALHIFDEHRIDTRDAVRNLIPAVITPELKQPLFPGAVDDHLGAYRAMAVLLPRAARKKLQGASHRTPTEIADFVQLPDFYVGIWLQLGDMIEAKLCGKM